MLAYHQVIDYDLVYTLFCLCMFQYQCAAHRLVRTGLPRLSFASAEAGNQNQLYVRCTIRRDFQLNIDTLVITRRDASRRYEM